MERPRRRPDPAAIDLIWVSCRGVRSSLPFHTPCLYASVCVTPSSAAGKNASRRRRQVKTPTDRAGGENPEWDERLRLHLPDDASPQEAAGNKKDGRVDQDDGILLVRFELKAEVAVLGDVLAASAVVPLSHLVADGRTRRVSYQLTASSDGRQQNGVISFSYAFHHGTPADDEQEQDGRSSSDGEPVTPPACLAPPSPPPQSTQPSGMYPVIDWPLENLAVYPPPASSETLAEPIAVYPPPVVPETTSSRGIYPAVGEPYSSLYPTVDFAPVSCYPPYYGGGLGYPAAPPACEGRCLYG